jgi:MarR family transcriptional regulator for hemolysin
VSTSRDRSDVFGQLLADVSKVWRHRLNVELRPYGLNCTLRYLLQELLQEKNGLMQRELAQRIGIESATLVGLVDLLSKHGWVERRHSLEDRRCKTVHLTPSGRQLLVQSEDVVGALRHDMLASAESEDLEACIRVFRSILERQSGSHSGDAPEPFASPQLSASHSSPFPDRT